MNKKWLIIWLLCVIAFAITMTVVGYYEDKEAGYYTESIILASETLEVDQLPEKPLLPDMTGMETYDPMAGYIGNAVGGVVGFGSLFYFLKKRDNKLDSIDNKLDKVDNKVGIISVKVDRNIKDIQSIRDDLQDSARVKRLIKEVNNV